MKQKAFKDEAEDLDSSAASPSARALAPAPLMMFEAESDVVPLKRAEPGASGVMDLKPDTAHTGGDELFGGYGYYHRFLSGRASDHGRNYSR